MSATPMMWYRYSSGHAEWEDSTATTLAVYYKSPAVIGEEIYSWALEKGYMENILTIYELYAGEDHLDLGGWHEVGSALPTN